MRRSGKIMNLSSLTDDLSAGRVEGDVCRTTPPLSMSFVCVAAKLPRSHEATDGLNHAMGQRNCTTYCDIGGPSTALPLTSKYRTEVITGVAVKL